MGIQVTKTDPIGCSNPETHWGNKSKVQIITLDLWDGPVHGLLRCGVCHAEYEFNLVDWEERDVNGDLRISVLTPVTKGTFESAVSLLGSNSPPSWPVWIPRCSPDTSDKLTHLVSTESPPDLLLAWEGNWNIRFIKAIRLEDFDLADVRTALSFPRSKRKGQDWFQFMGLRRG
jgi:hypothetical protein